MNFQFPFPFLRRTCAIYLILLFNTRSALAQNNIDDNKNTSNRTAAEWEPALGTLVVWPLSIPYKLAVELAKDNHLYTMIKDEAGKKDALNWYQRWRIDSARNTFIYAPQGIDAWWTRDWGPHSVFSRTEKMRLGDGKYIFSTPESGMGCSDTLTFLYQSKNGAMVKTTTEDEATVPLAKSLHFGVLDLPFITTGGNVLTDGAGTAFSSCILLNENKFYQVDELSFRKMNQELLGFRNYHILPNFEKMGIQHVDCFMKLLDEERILVAEPPKGHVLFSLYDSIAKHSLATLKSAYGRPYQILRIKTGRYSGESLAAYTNSLILNKTIYVPLFRIKEDSLALKTFRKCMPGYVVKGFYFDLKDEPVVSNELKSHYKKYGWNSGDALHCRTRAIWDPEMLLIQVKKVLSSVYSGQTQRVSATITDYSKKGIIEGSVQLNWKLSSDSKWKSIPMKQAENPELYKAEIPSYQKGKTVEYYISATSHSGKKETMPRTAPFGTYTFTVK